VHGAVPLVFREKVGTLISSARRLKHKSSSGGSQGELEHSSQQAIKMMSLEPAASNNASPDKNVSSGLQVAVIDDGGDDGGNEQFATKALLRPKKAPKQQDGKAQAVTVGGKSV